MWPEATDPDPDPALAYGYNQQYRAVCCIRWPFLIILLTLALILTIMQYIVLLADENYSLNIILFVVFFFNSCTITRGFS